MTETALNIEQGTLISDFRFLLHKSLIGVPCSLFIFFMLIDGLVK